MLTTLNLLDITTDFHTVIIFVMVVLQNLYFYIICVFTTNHDAHVHIPSSSGSLVITIELKVKSKFSHGYHMVLHFIKAVTLIELVYFLNSK